MKVSGRNELSAILVSPVIRAGSRYSSSAAQFVSAVVHTTIIFELENIEVGNNLWCQQGCLGLPVVFDKCI